MMIIAKRAAGILLAGALMLPLAGFAADGDSDRSSPSAFVKDSVITAKIKAQLAEEKLSTLVKIRVDTDKRGAVVAPLHGPGWTFFHPGSAARCRVAEAFAPEGRRRERGARVARRSLDDGYVARNGSAKGGGVPL